MCIFILLNQPLTTNKDMGFFDGPVIETELPMQGAQVLSLIRELRSYTHTHTQCSKKILVRLFTMCSCLYGLKFLEVELYLSISVYIYIYIYIFFFSSIWPCHAACGILVPPPGSQPHPLLWKCSVLTTGLPGKSQHL